MKLTFSPAVKKKNDDGLSGTAGGLTRRVKMEATLEGWKIGQEAPPPSLETEAYFSALGKLVRNEEPLNELALHLVTTYGTATVGLMTSILTTSDLRASLSMFNLNMAYEQTIGTFLVAPGKQPHVFLKPAKRTIERRVGGSMEKKLFKTRKSITQELGGVEGLKSLFDKLSNNMGTWCSVKPKATRLSQPEVDTISACFVGAIVQECEGNIYADCDFLSAADDFLVACFPLLNIRSGNTDRSWCAARTQCSSPTLAKPWSLPLSFWGLCH